MAAPRPSRSAPLAPPPSPSASRAARGLLLRALGGGARRARAWGLGALVTTLALTACSREAGTGIFGDDRFVGSYRTTWGPVVLREQGDELEGLYRRGHLRCVPDGRRLHCAWAQGSASGQATLRRRDDGLLEGTWGRGERDDDGGTWLWAPD